MTAFLDATLFYAARGWPVFPCNPKPDKPGAKIKRAKSPLVGQDKDEAGNKIPRSGGLHKATTDPDLIRQWWTKWPKALIGVRTGANRADMRADDRKTCGRENLGGFS